VKTFTIKPIGVIRSEIKKREDAPLFYTEGAPDAFLEVMPAYTDALDRMKVGDEIIVITWLHRAREVTSPILLRESSRPGHPIVRTPWGSIA